MHPIRRIEEIKSTLEDAETSAAAVRAAARLLETSGSIGDVLEAVASEPFRATVIACSEGCPPEEERAWLTFAAVKADRARLALAWRASEVLDPAEIVEILSSHRGRYRDECRRRAGLACGDAAGAWRLLACLRSRELRRLIRARPALGSAYRRQAKAGPSRRRAPGAVAPGRALSAGAGAPSFG